MQPNGAKKNKLAHAMFSKDGPNLSSPDVTKRPKVTPNIYKHKSKRKRGGPKLNTETPKEE